MLVCIKIVVNVLRIKEEPTKKIRARMDSKMEVRNVTTPAFEGSEVR